MAIQIEASYAKKLGLPNFSSHSFMVTVRAEVSSLRRLETESTRLYQLLQSSVDKQVQQVGFLPDATKYGMIVDHTTAASPVSQANGSSASAANNGWKCSEKQRSFIEKTAKRMKLSWSDLDQVAKHLFQLPAAQLDKRQASGLIDELFAMDGRPLSPRGEKHSTATPELS